MNYFPKYFSKKAIITFFVVELFCIIIFSDALVSILWYTTSAFIFIAFFYYLNKLSKSWLKYSDHSFKKKLFTNALLIRLITSIFLYVFFVVLYKQPFEFEAADSLSYHLLGKDLSEFIIDGELNLFEKLWYIPFSDRGYYMVLGYLYPLIFNSIILMRIVHTILGSYTCVLIYKISKRNFDETTARISGIVTMLLPNLIYYTGLHLKETVMIFLLVAFIDRADYLLRRKKISIKSTVIVGILGVSLFLFRTVLGASAFVALFGAIIFSSSKISGIGQRILSGIWIASVVFIFLSDKIVEETEQYWNEKDTNLENQMSHFSTNSSANRLSEYGSSAIFAPIILFAPFPTLVNIEGQDKHMMLGGAYFTRNIYAFFVIVCFISLYRRKKLRNHLLITLFVFFYLAILANSGFALSERFHLPILPFLAIFVAYGITQTNKKNKKYFVPYLILIAIIIIGWNWFKLAGRGLV